MFDHTTYEGWDGFATEPLLMDCVSEEERKGMKAIIESGKNYEEVRRIIDGKLEGVLKLLACLEELMGLLTREILTLNL